MALGTPPTATDWRKKTRRRSRVPTLDKSAELRKLFRATAITQVAGVSDALSGMLAEESGFDALWASGFAISASNGVPDASILTMTELLACCSVIDRGSTLPVVADCDSGFGDVAVVAHMVRLYERMGIAAVCIEDKPFPKRNSFVGGQHLVPPEEFAAKINAAKAAQTSESFIVIARTEALIAGAGVDEAFERACCYQRAGADAILIHSKAASPTEVIEFADRWRQYDQETPLIAVPTTYYNISAAELAAVGFNMVIYANHALRASVQAMSDVFRKIRIHEGTGPVEDRIASVDRILALSGMNELTANDDANGALPSA